ncbi:Conserved hypothetical secreted protein [Bifidobacterium breve 31L]|nr:Conserved hypothetical secreted protein [Bifidobacterium breve 31L]
MSTGKTSRNARLPFGARIALAIAAAVLVLIAGVAGANLSATVTFNRATASLKANIKAAQDESTDMDTLNAQQQQTDAQFAEANSMRAVLLPQIKDAIDANAAASAQLTKITLQQVEAQRNGTDAQNSTDAQSSSTSNGNATKSGNLTDEQKKAGGGADEGQPAVHRHAGEYRYFQSESGTERGQRRFQTVVMGDGCAIHIIHGDCG